MRSRITRRLVIAVAIAALAVPAGIAVATPPSGITKAEVLGQGTFSERVKVKAPNIKAKFKPSEFVVQDLEIAPVGTRAGTAIQVRRWRSSRRAPSRCTTVTTASAGRTATGQGRRSSTRAAATSTSAATRPDSP